MPHNTFFPCEFLGLNSRQRRQRRLPARDYDLRGMEQKGQQLQGSGAIPPAWIQQMETVPKAKGGYVTAEFVRGSTMLAERQDI